MSDSPTWHVARTMRVLEMLAFAPLSAPELADALGASSRTIRRLLARLVQEQYVVCDGAHRRRYRTSMYLVALAGQVLSDARLTRRAAPYLTLAHERTGATVELLVPSYRSVLCVMRCTASGEMMGPAVLESSLAESSAAGMLLLASRDRWRDSVLSDVPGPRLLASLAGVRESGFAHADHDGEQAFAAAVVIDGEAEAAIQIRGGGLAVDAAAAVQRTAREFNDNLRLR